MDALYSCRHIRFVRAPLKQTRLLILVKSRNGDNVGSKRLCISHFDSVALFTVTIQELPILSRAESFFVENQRKSAVVYASTFYTNAKSRFAELTALFTDNSTESSSVHVKAFFISMSPTFEKAFHVCRSFSAACVHRTVAQMTE